MEKSYVFIYIAINLLLEARRKQKGDKSEIHKMIEKS